MPLARLGDPVGLRQVGHVGAEDLPALIGGDPREVGAHPEHRLSAEAGHVLRDTSVADHPPQDVQGGPQQPLKLRDAGLEVFVEAREGRARWS